jgi:hypothetical protein
MIRPFLLCAAAVAASAAPKADLSISAFVNGATLTISTSARVAGAIESLTWRGEEFINAHDHGRELQSASSFDGYGECLNPTEAGSAKDGTGPTSSSRLVHSSAGGETLKTTIEMAYWLAPGTPYHRACGSHPDFQQAKNETVRSADKLIKRVKIEKDVIRFDITFVTTANHQSATFEVLTGYMPPEFSEFLVYDPAKHEVSPISDGPGEQTMPVILATKDHEYAMGVFSKELPQKTHPKNGYGRFRFLQNPKILGWNTVKWNAVYREAPVPKGKYRYRCYVAVGTLKDVRKTMERLHSMR